MDQAMGDLQTQLEDMRRMWEEERDARQRVEEELEVIRGGSSVGNRGERRERSPGRDGNEISAQDGDESRGGKRQRVSD
jgi:bHLH factor